MPLAPDVDEAEAALLTVPAATGAVAADVVGFVLDVVEAEEDVEVAALSGLLDFIFASEEEEEEEAAVPVEVAVFVLPAAAAAVEDDDVDKAEEEGFAPFF